MSDKKEWQGVVNCYYDLTDWYNKQTKMYEAKLMELRQEPKTEMNIAQQNFVTGVLSGELLAFKQWNDIFMKNYPDLFETIKDKKNDQGFLNYSSDDNDSID